MAWFGTLGTVNANYQRTQMTGTTMCSRRLFTRLNPQNNKARYCVTADSVGQGKQQRNVTPK